MATYTVYRDGAEIGRATALRFSDRMVQACETHQYSVDAVDAAGNRSAQSGRVRPLDTSPPAPVSDLSVQRSIPGGIANVPDGYTLRWSPAVDNFCTASYEVWLEQSLVTQVSERSYFHRVGTTGLLTCEDIWDDYTVVAVDRAGNRSPASNVARGASCSQ